LADALVRSNLHVSAIGLEFNFGYRRGCAIRDLMEISHRLDAWSYLGIPLVAFVTCPSQTGIDSQAVGEESVLEDVQAWVNPDWQSQWALDMSRVLLAKRSVQGIVWNQWTDGAPHYFPHGGLFDLESRPKIVLKRLGEFRREHLV
jgi:hypothetical protein